MDISSAPSPAPAESAPAAPVHLDPQALEGAWRVALASLQRRIQPHHFETWIAPLSLDSTASGRLTIRAPHRFMKEWFEDNYLDLVLDEITRVTGGIPEVAFCVDDSATRRRLDPAPAGQDAQPTSLRASQQATQVAAAPSERPIFSPLVSSKLENPLSPATLAKEAAPGRPALPAEAAPARALPAPAASLPAAGSALTARYTFDRFVVGPSNQFAHAASMVVADTPGEKYNPLFLYGGVGLGKTHLLQAIGHAFLARCPQARVIYLSGERFLNDYIFHLQKNRMEDFRRRYREQCDALLMDDIQFIAGKDRTQDEFFHTFNALYEAQRQIVLTSDKYPHEIPELEERLRSRFQWGLIADIQTPELETRVAILKRKAEAEAIDLDDDSAHFLASVVRSNVRELEGSLIRVAAAAQLRGQPISVDFARETLECSLPPPPTLRLSADAVQRAVADGYGVKLSDLRGSRRHRGIVEPRQVAMYLTRKLAGASFPEIARAFDRDHSTVQHACDKIAHLIETDPAVRETVNSIERRLQSR